MKFVFALLVIYLVAISFATTTKAQAKANAAASEAATKEAISSLQRLSSTKLGKTLIDTLQIELKVKSGADPRPRISSLLGEIRDETEDQIATLNANIQAARDQHAAYQATLQSNINGLQARIQEDTDAQTATAADLADQTQTNEAAQQNGEALEGELEALDDARASQHAQFESEIADRQRLIDVASQVVAFIRERLEQRENPSFLQKNNVLVEIKRKVSSSEFQTTSSGWGKFISFLVTKALDKIRQTPDDQAVEELSRVVNVFNDFIDSQREDINVRTSIEQSAVAAYESQRDDLETQIENNNNVLATSSLAIANDQATLDALAAALEQANNDLADNQSALAADEAQQQQDEEQYSDSYSQRNYELEIIQEVIDIVNNQLTNLSAVVENAANNVADE